MQTRLWTLPCYTRSQEDKVAHWTDRVERGLRRGLELLGRVLEDALRAGNRRKIAVRDKGGKTLLQTPLTYVVLGALVIFFLAQPLLPLLLIGLVVAYALGYRAAVVPAAPPR